MKPLTKDVYEKELEPILNHKVRLTTLSGETFTGIFWPSTTWGDPDETEEFELYTDGIVIAIEVSDTKTIEDLET